MTVDVFISYHTASSLSIVESIVNKLEDAGLNCWYASRNSENAYADDIGRAIKSCKIFLLILNKQSSESVHVLNELDMITKRLANHEKVLLIPFAFGDEEVSLGAQYYSGRFDGIDATKPPMYARINELVKKVTGLLSARAKETGGEVILGVISRTSNYRLIEKVPQVRDIFVGREELLRMIRELFDDGNRVLFLEGIGGIGKTELAKQYAIKNRRDYDQIIFVRYLTNLRDLVCDPSAFEITGLAPRPDEAADEYFTRKIQVLRTLLTDRTLVIVDNYDVDNDPDFDAFIQGQHKILITSRNTHSNYPSLKVNALTDEGIVLKFFAMSYGDAITEEDRPYIAELLKMTEYHTYTIELLAKQMAASFMSGKELLTLFRKGQLSSGVSEKIDGRIGKTTAFEHIKAVFSVNKLSEEEIQVMRELSLVGNGGIVAAHFKTWAGLSSFDVVNGLIRRGWVRREEGRKISLHPLVQEVVRETLKPTPENCCDFLHGLTSFVYRSWFRPYTENIPVKDNVLSILECMQPFEGKHIDMWASFPSFLWQVGEFEASIYYGHIVFDTCLKSHGEASIATGFVAKALAGCYFNSRRLEEAVSWYERGLRSMLAAGEGDSEDLAMSYEKAARCATWKFCRDFKKAEEYFNAALIMRKRLLERLENGQKIVCFEKFEQYDVNLARERIGETYFEMGRMYQAMGDYRKALECTELYGQNIADGNNSAFAYAYYDKGISHYHLGLEYRALDDEVKAESELNAALEQLTKALEINIQMRGGLAIDTIDNQEAIADTYVALHRYAEASNAYTAALTMSEKLLGEKHPRADRIKDKMNFGSVTG